MPGSGAERFGQRIAPGKDGRNESWGAYVQYSTNKEQTQHGEPTRRLLSLLPCSRGIIKSGSAAKSALINSEAAALGIRGAAAVAGTTGEGEEPKSNYLLYLVYLICLVRQQERPAGPRTTRFKEASRRGQPWPLSSGREVQDHAMPCCIPRAPAGRYVPASWPPVRRRQRCRWQRRPACRLAPRSGSSYPWAIMG